MAAVLLAPRDLDEGAGFAAAQDILAEARALLAGLAIPPSPLPFTLLARLHGAIGASPRFAPGERASSWVGGADLRLLVERAPAPSPRWAIEAVIGETCHTRGYLRHALPLPGLVRLDALDDGEAPLATRILRANALSDVAQQYLAALTDATRLAGLIAQRLPARRTSSRAPALAGLLAGWGPMRSAQIEGLLGATRLGVRGMLATLADAGLLAQETLLGVKLYSFNAGPPSRFEVEVPSPAPAVSSEALADFDASMEDLDTLLARHGIAFEETDDR